MFIGHLAVGFAAKRWAPRVSLPLLILAPNLLDALWPVFLALGIESVRIDPGNTAVTPLDLHDYPWSHSLLMALVWSALAAFFGWMALRRIKVAGLFAALVFSHWILDFVTHRPDMPLWPGSATYVGLGLWNSKIGTVLVEGALFAAGIIVYLRSTRPKDRTGTFSLVGFVSVLLLLYAADMVGPPPPSVRAVMIATFVLFAVFLTWSWFIERHREPTR
jgi:hypothetical protein